MFRVWREFNRNLAQGMIRERAVKVFWPASLSNMNDKQVGWVANTSGLSNKEQRVRVQEVFIGSQNKLIFNLAGMYSKLDRFSIYFSLGNLVTTDSELSPIFSPILAKSKYNRVQSTNSEQASMYFWAWARPNPFVKVP